MQSPARAVILGNKVVRSHHEYVIEVESPGKKDAASAGGASVVSRRFREFDEFHGELKSALAGARTSLPALPPKKFFGNMRPTFVSRRQIALQQYLDAVREAIDSSSSKGTRKAWAIYCKFLGVFSQTESEAYSSQKTAGEDDASTPSLQRSSAAATARLQAEQRKEMERLERIVEKLAVNLTHTGPRENIFPSGNIDSSLLMKGGGADELIDKAALEKLWNALGEKSAQDNDGTEGGADGE